MTFGMGQNGPDPLALLRAGSIGRTRDLVDRISAMELLIALGPDVLISPLYLNGRLFPHQLGACAKALLSNHKGLLLADEVGLGKTVEAGLIIKEMEARGKAGSILILTPASLTTQWRDELSQLLGIEMVIWGEMEGADVLAKRHPRLVCSLDMAKAPSHIEAIRKVHWDIVVIDEAHRLKDKGTRNFKLVESLDRGYLLLLTATPIHNRLTELFNEVTLIDEELLGTENAFKRNFFKDKKGVSVKNIDMLKHRVAPVTIRNRRDELKEITFVKRFGRTISFDLSRDEEALYDEVTSFVRREYRSAMRKKRGARGFLLILYQRMLSSTPYAIDAALSRRRATIERTLARVGAADAHGKPINGMDIEYTDMNNELSVWKELETAELELELDEIVRLEAIAKRVRTSTKTDRLMELISTLEPDQKALVFTEFRATQDHIMRVLAAKGIPAVAFNGSMSRTDKDVAVTRFSRDARIMVSTESGGEGRNLQFCNVLVNFDLPWNPMKVEQRIGRLHRIGQERNVTIFNFSTNGTIEEYIIFLLEKKIRLFEDVIGDLDMIIGEVCGGEGFERTIMRIFTEAEREQRVRQRKEAAMPVELEDLGWRIEEAREIAKDGDDRTGRTLDRLGLATPMDIDACLTRLDDFQVKVKRFTEGWLKRRGARLSHIDDGHLETTVPRELAVGLDLPPLLLLSFGTGSMEREGKSMLVTMGEPILERMLSSSLSAGQTAICAIEGLECQALQFTFEVRFPLFPKNNMLEHVTVSIDRNTIMPFHDVTNGMLDTRGPVKNDLSKIERAYERAIAEVKSRAKVAFSKSLDEGLGVEIQERKAIGLELYKDKEQDIVDEERTFEDTKFRLLEKINGCKEKDEKERCSHQIENLNKRLRAVKEANEPKKAAMREELKRRMEGFDRALEGQHAIILVSVILMLPSY